MPVDLRDGLVQVQPDAVLRIFELTGGVPRKINSMATNALLVAYGSDTALIDSMIINEIKDELML